MYTIMEETQGYMSVNTLKLIVCDGSCVGLLIVQWILSGITAGSPMVVTPINQVRRQLTKV